MIAPCMVNSSLYTWPDARWLSGPISRARMTIAISPPHRKKNEVIRYRWPITVWSVDDSQPIMTGPSR